MPITKADVLAALDDPALKKLQFTAGAITVSAGGYQDVRDYVNDDDIKVTPGTGALAFYDSRKNEIETQAGDPPLNLADRAQLLHECTHAIVDIYGWSPLRREDEVAAYLAQLTYMTIASPSAFPKPHRLTGSPMGNFVYEAMGVIQQHSLHLAKGFGARVDDMDLWRLSELLARIPDYAAVRKDEISAGAGVASNHNQMRGLKSALKGAKRATRHSAGPSRRLEIF